MPKAYSIVASQHIQGADAFIKTLVPGVTAVLIREPQNQYDANAIAVWIEGRKVGYIPKNQNKVLAAFIDDTGVGFDQAQLIAMDQSLTTRAVTAIFTRSPNSSFPMVEV